MATAPIAAMGAVNDPRLDNDGLDQTHYPSMILRKLHDPSIPIEEYLHWAKITRADEERLYGPGSGFHAVGGRERFIKEKIFRMKLPADTLGGERRRPSLTIGPNGEALGDLNAFSEKQSQVGRRSSKASGEKGVDAERRGSVVITDEEWVRASRAARTATWGAVFYLITTDILGPFTTGYAFSQLGFGPGISLFTVFGALAGYSGYQLWRMYLQLDSDRYPMKGYGDIAFRIYGTWFRHVVNLLQSFQFFMNVTLIAISSGQSISQMSTEGLCFIVCILVCIIFGCLVGQIRTLQRFGWLASFAVFLNLLIIFFSMGVMAHSPPNYKIIAASYPAVLPPSEVDNPPPIFYYAGLPPGLTLVDNVNGLMNAVFSFGGATLFCELMAEMRRPLDFWKGLLCADILIYVIYMVYGCYTYGMQGQYVYNTSYQGLSPYAWQTFGNVLGLISGLIAAVLYGNIGIKVLYNNLGRDLLHFPILESKKGKWLWVGIVPLYWILAFIIGVSVPQITSWIVFVGAAAILQFTYTFPPFMMVGFKSQRDAILPEETFDPATSAVHRVDSGMKRWIRGYKKEFFWNLFDTVFALGAFTTGILGIYAAIVTMNDAYHNGSHLTGWSCQSPTG